MTAANLPPQDEPKRVQSANPDCTDRMDNDLDYWSCIEFDGTGLWCDSCLAVAAPSRGLS